MCGFHKWLVVSGQIVYGICGHLVDVAMVTGIDAIDGIPVVAARANAEDTRTGSGLLLLVGKLPNDDSTIAALCYRCGRGRVSKSASVG